jgi:hypothetical protein
MCAGGRAWRRRRRTTTFEFTRIHTNTHKHARTHTHEHTNTQSHTHRNTKIHTHTHTHTNTHTHTQLDWIHTLRGDLTYSRGRTSERGRQRQTEKDWTHKLRGFSQVLVKAVGPPVFEHLPFVQVVRGCGGGGAQISFERFFFPE